MGHLTRRQLEDAIYQVACLCLDVEPDDARGRVRISWPVEGTNGSNPTWKREENICFLRIQPYRDPYARLQEVCCAVGGDGALRAAIMYTRAYEVQFICYGPSAMDDADAIRTCILREDVREFLRKRYALYPVAHIDEPLRADELENGQWWGRCDVSVRFYEGASHQYSVPSIDALPDIEYQMKR